MRIELVDYDPGWSSTFDAEARSIRGAIGELAVSIDHAGSTSVPGLAAKPVIDIALTVPDSADESAYVPRLVGVGYRFHLREPGWYEHRLLKRDDPAVNLHIFTVGSVEVSRMLRFRDILRADEALRLRYETVKRALAERTWGSVQEYADAKSGVISEILDHG
jgi:GrpB-like predicted nucleotidyltransferase (UPF0157 family)